MDGETINVYGDYKEKLENIMEDITDFFEKKNEEVYDKEGFKLYEHLSARVKSEKSMVEKLERKGLEINEYNALHEVKDAIGIRIICAFIDDIYELIGHIKEDKSYKIIEEKDYIKKAKPNGYRSYHLIIEIETDFPDVEGNVPGKYYAEMQFRTIAMDSWASLEHQLKIQEAH